MIFYRFYRILHSLLMLVFYPEQTFHKQPGL